MLIRERLPHYVALMRFNKPIGTLLLLWPTLWALWLASQGHPDPLVLVVFIMGVFLMRSAGCVMNDYADRHVDGYIERTRQRPLAAGKVTAKEALLLAAVLALLAFLLVLLCNTLTIMLSFVGAILAITYPFMKRFTHLPQLGLGVAFSWGIPMAFAAQTGTVSLAAWTLFASAIIWPVAYDTMYAMIDRSDDIKVGVKSIAILFSEMDKFIIGILQMLFLVMLVIVGLINRLHLIFYMSLVAAAGLFLYQQWLIKGRNPSNCFRAFLNNNWVGCSIFIGIFLSYLK